MTTPAPRPPGPQSPLALGLAFNRLALQGFGGVLAVAQREIVERQAWLTRAQFVELLSIAQVLPGPNIVNLALMFGDRLFGWRGAAAALAGLITVPLLIVIALTVLYLNAASVPAVAGALRGMGAVAAGLVMATGLKLVGSLRGNVLGASLCVVVGVATALGIAWLRVPLVWVLAGVGGLSFAIAWARLGR